MCTSNLLGSSSYLKSVKNYIFFFVQADDVDSSGDPPVFLRFINLLVNDATFLLDEALQVGIMLHTSHDIAVVTIFRFLELGLGLELG